MTDAPDDALLERVAAGDRPAFDALVERLAPLVWPLLRRLTLDEGRAEDALQETFLAVWRSAPGYRGEAGARAWVFGLARRQAARTWRRRAGEPARPESLESLALEAGWGQDPEVLASRAQDRAAVLDAVGRLGETAREILTLCDLEGIPVVEAAAELGIAAGTARVRLHRARLELMAALRPSHEEVDHG